MDVKLRKQGESTIVEVTGKIDTHSAPEFEKQVKSRIEEGNIHLVVDCTELSYISSAGLRSLMVLTKLAKARGGALSCCCLTKMVNKVFAVSGFDKLLPVHETLDDALK